MDPSEYNPGWSNDDEVSPLKDHNKTSGLQELCLLAIIENFDILCFAFKTGDSKVPKKNWEFLERRYSEKIFEELKVARKLKSHHLDLLINPQTKKLDLEGINNELLPDLIMRLKERGTNVLTLKACDQHMDYGICNSLMSALPKVEEIDYLDEEFGDVETKSLRKKIFRFRKMSLRKRFAQIPQTCRAIGQNCQFLKRLKFQYYDILNATKYNEERRYSEKIFEELKVAGKLRSHHLDLLINSHTNKLDIEGINNELLPDLIMIIKERGTNILTLKACTERMDDGLCNSLMSALPKVEEIDYLDEEFREVETKSLRKKIFRFTKMSPQKRYDQIPQTCRAIGQNCRFLKSLNFQYYDILNATKYNEGIAFIIKNCPCLEMLDYRDTVGALYTLHKSDLSSLKSRRNISLKTGVKYLLKNLTSQRGYYKLRDALTVCVATCPHVSRLHIDYIENEEELEMISHFSHLENIQFDGMDVITANCFGKFLNLRGNKFTTLELPYKSGLPIETLIKCCPKLQSLKLSCVQVSEFNSASEKSCETGLPDLKTLEVSFTDFVVPSTAAALKHILSAAQNIENISLNGSSGITSKFFRSLELRNIRVLDASSSDITVDSLTELLLRGNLQRVQIEFCENLSYEDYFTLTRCIAENNKNVDIKYEPPRTDLWGDFTDCCMAYIP